MVSFGWIGESGQSGQGGHLRWLKREQLLSFFGGFHSFSYNFLAYVSYSYRFCKKGKTAIGGF